jgi:beta-phosphoglucomutase family hydrolase
VHAVEILWWKSCSGSRVDKFLKQPFGEQMAFRATMNLMNNLQNPMADWRLQDYTAILFDCDGTLADTMPAHYRAWLHVTNHHGIRFDEDYFYALGGQPTRDILATLASEASIEIDLDQASEMKEQAFLEQVAHVKAIDPVIAAVRRAHGHVPVAVVTGGYRDVCEKILCQIGVREYFDVIVASEDTSRHKPDPDPFLEAARRLGVQPEGCLVWEDSDLGVESARRAGMQWIDVRSFHQPERLTERATETDPGGGS